MAEHDDEDPRFLPILGYVLGFMLALAIAAFLAATLFHLFR